jgi:hypothetical protein
MRSSTTSNVAKQVSLRTASLMAVQNAIECSHALFCLLDQWALCVAEMMILMTTVNHCCCNETWRKSLPAA